MPVESEQEIINLTNASDDHFLQLPKPEQDRINIEIKSGLVDHLYAGTIPGIITGLFVSIIVFILLHKEVNLIALSIWFGLYTLTQFASLVASILYRRFKTKLSVQNWALMLSVLLGSYTVLYGSCIFFNPPSVTNRFIILALLLMSATSFSMVTVGMSWLCIVLISLNLIPVIIWFILQHNLQYLIAAVLMLVYSAFLVAMNWRSTGWLINSLRASKMLASLTHQANYDLLTDLPNQRLLTQYIEQGISNGKTSSQSFVLVCFGVNRLEIFNNSLGYQAGDLIMQSLTKRLEIFIEERENGNLEYILTLPRHDAFTILIKPKNPIVVQIDMGKINEELNQLFQVLESTFHLGKGESRLTASIGVATFPEHGNDWNTLLSNGYAAMFQAKMLGGNQLVYYKKEINERAPYLLELETDLHHALKGKQFELYYQPIIDLNAGRVSGMEALIRWNHPIRGFVSPLDFISLAEETNLIIPIGEWVLEEAATQVKKWNEGSLRDFSLKVAVNISPKQLRQGNLIGTIDRVLKKTGLDPRHLELELTETIILDAKVVPLVQEITKKGIGLSIDDFGTGYSGLSYLKVFSIDKIKIDKSFIDDIALNTESATIVSAILAMVKELGIKTLAEGVETQDQLEFLESKGCRYIQGFYFSKPLKAKDFVQYVQNNSK